MNLQNFGIILFNQMDLLVNNVATNEMEERIQELEQSNQQVKTIEFILFVFIPIIQNKNKI